MLRCVVTMPRPAFWKTRVMATNLLFENLTEQRREIASGLEMQFG